MNINEYGVQFAMFTNFDMSAYTTITIDFWMPNVCPVGNPPTLTVSNPDVTVPNTDFVYPGGTLPANMYALYTFVQGDIIYPGLWSARVFYATTSPTVGLYGAVGTFKVCT